MLLFFIISVSVNAQNLAIEDIQKVLYSRVTPQSLALGRAEKALEKKHFEQALKDLTILEKNKEYADAYHFLIGKIRQQKMLKLMKEDQDPYKYQQALNQGARAIDHFLKVPTVNLSSAFKSSALKELGKTEISMALCFLALKKNQEALRVFENGFQHLSLVKLLQLVTSAEISTYAKLCDASPNETCTSWEVKLLPLLSKSEQAQIFSRISGLKPIPFEKLPSIPYKEELDVKAFQRGFQFYLLGEYENAYSIWWQLLKDYSRTSIKLRTKFWMGRASQKSNHPLQAETLYKEVIQELPFSYYALLASWFSGIDIFRMIDSELPMVSLGSPFLAPTEIAHMHRAEIFIASGAFELAQNELQEVHYKNNIPNEFLIYLAFLNYLDHHYSTSFQLISELSNRGFTGLFSTFGQRLLFPTPYVEIVHLIAKDFRMDPLFLLSIAKQESGFDPEVTSTSNAYGLMQLISPTARELSEKIEVIDLLSPQRNIQLGANYIDRLMKQYKNNMIWALSAYNAGPQKVDLWLKDIEKNKHTQLPPEELIELIPFRETHDYVENIFRNYYWYHRREGDVFPTFEALLVTH